MHAIRLRTEHLQNPMGIDITTPMMHWNCAEGLRQNAFQLKCTDAHGALLWDSGKQTGAQMCVRYAGKPLCSHSFSVLKRLVFIRFRTFSLSFL